MLTCVIDFSGKVKSACSDELLQLAATSMRPAATLDATSQ